VVDLDRRRTDLSQALAADFAEVVGVDVSPTMIEKAAACTRT